jgi:hypothetical protein
MRRYALCLHGLIGSLQGKSGDKVEPSKVLKLCKEHWKKYILDENNLDVFIFSWNLEEQDKINKSFRPKVAVYSEQKVFDIPDWIPGEYKRKQNHYSRWYAFYMANELKRVYESENGFTYDIVMNARFDVAWRKPILFDDLNKKYLYVNGWYRKENEKKLITSKYKDFWFAGSSENMDNFSNLYNKIEEYMADGCPTNPILGISSHFLTKYHAEKLDFDTKFILKSYKSNEKLSDAPLIREIYGA